MLPVQTKITNEKILKP